MTWCAWFYTLHSVTWLADWTTALIIRGTGVSGCNTHIVIPTYWYISDKKRAPTTPDLLLGFKVNWFSIWIPLWIFYIYYPSTQSCAFLYLLIFSFCLLFYPRVFYCIICIRFVIIHYCIYYYVFYCTVIMCFMWECTEWIACVNSVSDSQRSCKLMMCSGVYTFVCSLMELL